VVQRPAPITNTKIIVNNILAASYKASKNIPCCLVSLHINDSRITKIGVKNKYNSKLG
jgi:hypothetical protein